MSIRRASQITAITTLFALIVGCAAPEKPNQISQLTLHLADRDAFITHAASLLRRHDLPPKRLERANGLIVSQPTTSGQWFEFWRIDSRGPYQSLESSLHTIRRTVTVRVTPIDDDTPAPDTQPVADDDAYRVTVRVDKERFSAPHRQITTASGALAIYSEQVPTRSGLRGRRSRLYDWVALGRDPLLEDYLLSRLANLPQVRAID